MINIITSYLLNNLYIKQYKENGHPLSDIIGYIRIHYRYNGMSYNYRDIHNKSYKFIYRDLKGLVSTLSLKYFYYKLL